MRGRERTSEGEGKKETMRKSERERERGVGGERDIHTLVHRQRHT